MSNSVRAMAACLLGNAFCFIFAGVLQLVVSEVREYCFPNSFNVSCDRSSVIVMTSARYGRIQKGQCLSSDYHIGCSANVLLQLDRKCSGRHSCVVSIPDTTLHDLQPCPKDLLAYLQAEYTCQKVENRTSSNSCRFLGDLVVGGHSGSLASIVTTEQEFGSSRCPWLITMPRGQKVKLDLLDFGVVHRMSDSGVVCHVYARLQEPTLATATTVCGSRTRERSVYISETNQVEVAVMNFRFNDEQVYFLINYEAAGCVDPVLPRGSWLKRSADTAVITCNHTTQVWHIVCQGNTWFGKIDNCTAVESDHLATYTLAAKPNNDFHYGLAVAVVTGLILGVVVGVAMLAVVIACHTKRRSSSSVCVRESPYSSRLDALQDSASSAVDGKKFIPGTNNQYEYAHVCGFHPLPYYAQGFASSSPPGVADGKATVAATDGGRAVPGGGGEQNHRPGFGVVVERPGGGGYPDDCRGVNCQIQSGPDYEDKSQTPDEMHWSNSTSG